MPKNHLYLQSINKVRENISTNQFLSASDDLRKFMDEKGGLSNGFYTLPDPTFAGYKPFFSFHDESGLLADGENGAEAYLNRIGEDKRADLLQVFKSLLQQIVSEYSHQFLGVEGLSEAYSKGHYMLTNEELPKIKFTMFETLDMKISSLNQMYKQICYDSERKVHVLPRNIRNFTMYVYVYDVQFYTTTLTFLPSFENQDLASINHQMFEFSYCEFNQESGMSYFDSVARDSNVASVVNDITINYEKCEMSSLFRNITGDSPIDSNRLSMFNSVLTDFIVGNLEDNSRFSDPNEDTRQNSLEIAFEKSESQVDEDGRPSNS